MTGYVNNEKRLISESTPGDFTITTIPMYDVASSIQNFFDTNFRGSIITEEFPFFYEYTEISPDGLAYFFKVLLNAVFGESVVRVSITKEDRKFVIKTKWRNMREIRAEDLDELRKTARISGFELSFSQNEDFCEAYASLPLKLTNYISVYANSEYRMFTAFVRVFFL